MTSPPAALIGVASSAGTHHAGQEGAPAALRAAGFTDRLRAAGLTVEDHGDLLNEVFVADAQRHDPTAGLLYLDGDADLATPDTTSSGVLDAMGIAHLLGLADTEQVRADPRRLCEGGGGGAPAAYVQRRRPL